MTMDIPRVLEAMNLSDQDWGPDVSSYAALVKGWRGEKPVPLEEEMLTEWTKIQSDMALGKDKEVEAQRFFEGNPLFDSMFSYFAQKLGIDEATAKVEFQTMHKGR